MHKVELTFIEPLLGTLSGNKELAEEFIASKHPKGVQTDEVEVIEALPEQLEKSSTVFPRNKDGKPFLWDYQIKGFMKDACSMLRRVPDGLNKKLTAHKKIIDGLVFVTPRQIPLLLPDGTKELTWTERPLRAQTPQGERIALARSETAPAGTRLELNIMLLDEKTHTPYLETWFGYGQLRGLGQWRNSGMGRFTWRYRDKKN